ncbi:ribosomal protein S18-alanine N-acetyltransferase [Corynebacterium freiburgense]|uniref:ribosomal protein S18-alanine N-acetyltransferase n=1 Tax=Corynebacterium freiburgense TaxID=556548 RepID=UPI000428F954|nr:ribosomal protein S18-alanine N-acetyltransferase [Corynebacterium freiburgense]WJZ01737.1 ribosomal-protein-alanine N-acetyltransferase [Corynebacterium freiburgense]
MEMRRLAAHDAPACGDLELILFPEDSPWPANAFEAEFRSPFNFYIGLFDPELIGYAGLAMLGPSSNPEFEIHTIGVTPERQGEGLGRLLMDQLIAAADNYGGPIYLEVRTDNEPAIGLYKSYGFTITGTRKHYYQPSGADAFSMKREGRNE